ncbi:MAG: gamma-glutamyl-gamma-aminobutyrate hydrolase family protein [Lawsonibacter sp.]|nr:gamma-glutamyl-gamma-aminobutyrate hydrolase family protein [Lawsonibacter sp.]
MRSYLSICISTDGIYREDSSLRWIACPNSYPDAVAAAGGLPLLCNENCPDEMADFCDALLLTGGSDLSPNLYGEDILNDTIKINALRDSFEIKLATSFLRKRKPILAICRGFQLINVLLGGNLYQDLVAQQGIHHFDPQLLHPIRACGGSVLEQLFGTEFNVNSTHHQAVKNLGRGLKATAFSPEGLVEAYEHESGIILGTQFHPERLTGPYWDDRTPNMNIYFAYFVHLVQNEKNKALGNSGDAAFDRRHKKID